jgi:hypothetical protein
MVWVVIWGSIRIRFKNYAPLIVFLPPLCFALISNLQLRGSLPELVSDDGFQHTEQLSAITLILCLLINYNSYLVTIVVIPPLFLISYSLQATQAAITYFDPHTGMRLTQPQQEQYKLEYVLTLMLMIGVFVFHHYLVLQDLSTLVIEKHMLARH